MGMKTYLDWSAYDTYGVGDAYAGIPATGGNYAKAVAVCMNNHQCQRDGKGVMCPSYRITHDPKHSTGARVKAFKAALNGELGDEPFAHPDLAAAMDLCVSCKGCKKECPSAVDMTLIKTEYLAQRNARLGPSRRVRLFAGLPRWLHARRSLLKRLVRLRNASPWLAGVAERWLGISARRPIPEIVADGFTAPALDATGTRGKVMLFVDTFTHYYTPEVAEAIAQNVLQGWVAQLPGEMGYSAVKAAVSLCHGDTVPRTIATDFIVVTRANLGEPRVQALLGH